MSETQAQALAAKLESAATALLAEVDRLPQELLNWQPAPDVWSVMDILCHVEEFVPYWTAQALQIVAHPGELWGRDHTHAGRLAAVDNTASRRLVDVQASIRAGARQSAEAIRRLSDASLATEATSRNPRWGLKPASFVVDHLIVQHVEKHIGQVRRNAAQFAQRAHGPSHG
jgi:uncharacterized damage-inducible protein DinB